MFIPQRHFFPEKKKMSGALCVSFLIVRNSYYCELNKHKIYDFRVHITACYDWSTLKYNKIYTIMVIISTNFMTNMNPTAEDNLQFQWLNVPKVKQTVIDKCKLRLTLRPNPRRIYYRSGRIIDQTTTWNLISDTNPRITLKFN